MSLLLIYLLGQQDRIRGDEFGPGKVFDLAIYGWIASALIGHPLDLMALGFIACFTLGGVSGWPLVYVTGRGVVDEWWSFPLLEDNPLLAVIFRGAMWALAMAPMAYFGQEFAWAAASMFVAFPLSQIITRKLKETGRFDKYAKKFAGDWWGVMEWLRGLLFGGLIAIGVA